MSFLTSHTQVHPGLLVSLVELLLVAEKPLEDGRVEKLLAPNSLSAFNLTTPKGVVVLTLEAAEWLKLVKRSEGEVELTNHVKSLHIGELFEHLPTIIEEGLFKREWKNILTPEGLAVNRERGGDLGILLAWFMTQNSYDLKKLSDSVLANSWVGQLLDEKVPGGDFELVNETKLRVLRKWAKYLGYGIEISRGLVVPDPTKAIQRKLDDLKQKQIEYTASEFVSEVSKLFPVLDGGKIRKWVKVATENNEQIHWEHNPKRISPSLVLALKRLQNAGKIEFQGLPDSPSQQRQFLDDENTWISQVRIL